MKLLIVESPNKINTIQKIVGNDYKIIASYGHIRDLSKSRKDGIGINVLKDFAPKFAFMPNKVEVIQSIIDNAEKADEIYIATDPDREGEAISYHIYECIKDLGKPIKRISFDKIVKKAVLDALANPKEIDMNLVNSQICRRVLDRLVGYMVSPYLMNKYSQILSAGRVQSVATRMIVEREKQIKEFQPKEYWNLLISLNKNNLNFKSKILTEIKTEEAAKKVKEEISNPDLTSFNFEVVSVLAKSKKDPPKPPFNTAKLQQAMASKHGMNGETCMENAQSLYEKGLITYIRTDSVKTDADALNEIREMIVSIGLEPSEKINIYKDKENAQSAHECIRPTNINTKPGDINLSLSENLLYKAIWEQTISSQMKPAVYDTLEIKIKHKHSDHLFKTTGKALKYKGYLEFSNQELSEITLPNLEKGEFLKLSEENPITLEQKFTKPPSRYNYASFIEELENKGIGRPSTFANICKTIIGRSYVEQKDNILYGTELGEKITEELEKYFKFMEYTYTSKLEENLDEIELGKKSSKEILNNFFSEFKEKINKAHLDNNGVLCKGCNMPVYHKQRKDGVEYNICSMYPFCTTKNN